jgi:HD-like signal output (HDOD) protein
MNGTLEPVIPTKDVEAGMRIEVREIGIPPRPAILAEIETEMRKDEPDYKHLADLIGSDVSLAASLIKVSNSPFFGFNNHVRSIREALLVLGLRVIANTIAGLALERAFPKMPSLERFWDSSARSARVSGWLAQRLPSGHRVRVDDAYTYGLFRDCGVAVLMVPFPEYLGILQQANQEAVRPFTALEDDALSINHAIVGSELAEDWRLPAEIHAAIRYHHDLEVLSATTNSPLTATSRRLIAVAQTAEYLAQVATGLNQTREWDKLGAVCMEILGLDDESFEDIVTECRNVVTGKDAASIFGP